MSSSFDSMIVYFRICRMTTVSRSSFMHIPFISASVKTEKDHNEHLEAFNLFHQSDDKMSATILDSSRGKFGKGFSLIWGFALMGEIFPPVQVGNCDLRLEVKIQERISPHKGICPYGNFPPQFKWATVICA